MCSSDLIALFLDFDGTLAWIADRPAHASLPATTRRILVRLARHHGVRVCIVSARDYASLRHLVRAPGIVCFGLYGWQNGTGLGLPQQERDALKEARVRVVEHVRSIPGVWVEDKGQSFAVHYRAAAPGAAGPAGAALRRAIDPYADVLRVMRGKKAWDVLPLSVRGKGAAVRRELATHPASLAIYAGDDLSDESAFQAVAPKGIAIHVGARRISKAQFRLRDPGEVYDFLQKLEPELP